MPWTENKTIELRGQTITDYNEGESVVLAEIYNVSRKTIYKWLARHEESGLPGRADRSPTPHRSPTQLSDEIVAAIIAARQRWNWMPRKLRLKLVAAQPKIVWPVVSTIREVLKRAGLTQRRKVRDSISLLNF